MQACGAANDAPRHSAFVVLREAGQGGGRRVIHVARTEIFVLVVLLVFGNAVGPMCVNAIAFVSLQFSQVQLVSTKTFGAGCSTSMNGTHSF